MKIVSSFGIAEFSLRKQGQEDTALCFEALFQGDQFQANLENVWIDKQDLEDFALAATKLESPNESIKLEAHSDLSIIAQSFEDSVKYVIEMFNPITECSLRVTLLSDFATLMNFATEINY